MLHAGFDGLDIPLAQRAQPPDEILAAIASGRPFVRANRQVHRLSRALKFVCNLRARRTGAHYQHCPLGHLSGIAVGGGMNLQDPCICRYDGRNDRTLERTGGGDHVDGLDHAFRGFDHEAGAVGFLAKSLDLDTAADGSCDLLCVGFEILHDPVFGGKAVGIDAGEGYVWKSVMPSRTVGDKRVPSFRAPALGNPMSFDDEMRHSAFAQVLAHRQPGLAATYDKSLDLFSRCAWDQSSLHLNLAEIYRLAVCRQHSWDRTGGLRKGGFLAHRSSMEKR